jgi:hypothetical protein
MFVFVCARVAAMRARCTRASPQPQQQFGGAATDMVVPILALGGLILMKFALQFVANRLLAVRHPRRHACAPLHVAHDFTRRQQEATESSASRLREALFTSLIQSDISDFDSGTTHEIAATLGARRARPPYPAYARHAALRGGARVQATTCASFARHCGRWHRTVLTRVRACIWMLPLRSWHGLNALLPAGRGCRYQHFHAHHVTVSLLPSRHRSCTPRGRRRIDAHGVGKTHRRTRAVAAPRCGRCVFEPLSLARCASGRVFV